VLGFGGDTMHMARLLDSSRDKASGGAGASGYSLEALTEDLLGARKTPMKEIFGIGKPLKDGTPSKVCSFGDHLSSFSP
jgi:DNA polymerase I